MKKIKVFVIIEGCSPKFAEEKLQKKIDDWIESCNPNIISVAVTNTNISTNTNVTTTALVVYSENK